jgi:hypothetical protein
VPIRDGTKRPLNGAWTHDRYDYGGDLDEVRKAFVGFAQRGAGNLGVLLGEPSGGLIDIDLDHPKTGRLKDHFLPPTPMKSGRAGRPNSHYWYRVTGDGVIPATRQYKMPDGSVIVELRSTGGQTLIPPSVHPSGEAYRWEGRPREWRDPAEIPVPLLSVQVAFVALGTVLIDQWPRQGSRHDAYLALAGGLMRYGEDVHPWWERNAPQLIRILAQATGDEDGPDAREAETIRTTLSRLRGEKLSQSATGWPRLGEIIGEEHAELARRLAFEIETLSGFRKGTVTVTTAERKQRPSGQGIEIEGQRDPLEERETRWSRVDLGPYARGEIEMARPSVLRRTDGQGLLYPGRTNMLVAGTESGKTWIALQACVETIGDGFPVMFIDLEDGPAGTVDRLKALGVGYEDMIHSFTYLNPDEPLALMQKNRWGRQEASDLGRRNHDGLLRELESVNPSLIVVDGMSVLYGLHGLDTNDVGGTDVINTWLKSLVGPSNDRTVVIIDHTGKGAVRGSQPIGSQHKLSMVQGAAIQVYPVTKPKRGGVGELELIVIKDRPGWVRAVALGREGNELAATAVIDSTKEGVTSILIEAPAPDEIGVDLDADGGKVVTETMIGKLREYIPRVFAGDPHLELTGPEIQARVHTMFGIEYGDQVRRDAVEALVKAKILAKSGATSNSVFALAWP